MNQAFLDHLRKETAQLKEQGLYKTERVISSPQQAHITTEGRPVLNLCANNYLGLANHPRLIAAAEASLAGLGYGMASVRFICGTQAIHKRLEAKLSAFLGTEDTILYSSCFDANTGLFETLLSEADAIVSDELNHASIIDGIRLCKAKRLRYRNNDMEDLEAKLEEAKGCRFILIATDGVFSMDGTYANLPKLVELAERYGALTMVDDSHAVGFTGARGRGTPEKFGVQGQIDILTGTLGKALGGASGGYTSGRKEIVEWLRQRSRPYLFSNTLAPTIAAASIEALELLDESDDLRKRLSDNAAYFRSEMTKLGFNLVPGEHPIIPVMIFDAALAKRFADALLDEGVYVIGFSFPVVPHGRARIRTQMSAAHSREDLQHAVEAFGKVGRALGVIQ
jgi:glycine C-acetyltransferase